MFKIKELDNKIKLITIPNNSTKTATVLIIVGTGSKNENRNNNGISHFLEHMFFKGAKKYPTAIALSSELDSMGADYNAFTGKEYTGYWIKSEGTKVEKSIEIVSDMLLNSKMEEEEINREKGVIIEEYNMYEDNPMMSIEDVFEACLYGDTSAGWDTIGTKENINNFSRKDFVDYLEAQYNPANVVVCVAGNIDEEKVEDYVKKYFVVSEFNQRGDKFQKKEKVIEKQVKPKVKLKYKKTDQAHIALGVRTYDYLHADNDALKLLALILGGSMSSRLFINLRERKGLAYYVFASLEKYTDCGYLYTRAGVPVDKVEESIQIILDEFENLKNELVSEAELQKMKDLVAGKLAIKLESSDNVANWYASQAIMLNTIEQERKISDDDRKIYTAEEVIDDFRKISVQDIQRVACDIFVKEKLNLAIIGPFKKKKDFERILLR